MSLSAGRLAAALAVQSKCAMSIRTVSDIVPCPTILDTNLSLNSTHVSAHCHGRAFATAKGTSACWKCGHLYEGLFCSHCKAIQRPTSDNYFSILGTEQSFTVNEREIKKNFLKLQSVLHPDKFSNASEDEKQISADMSSLVNKAYRTILSPLDRAVYLLNLCGTHLPEGNTSFDQAFLMEIMELNEELESLTDRAKIEEFEARNKDILRHIEQEMSEAFSSENIEDAIKAVSKIKYFSTLQEKIKEKKQQLGIVD